MMVRDTAKLPSFDTMSQLGKQLIGAETASLSSVLLVAIDERKYNGQIKHYRFPYMAMAALEKGEVAAVLASRSEVEGGLVGFKNKAGFSVDKPPFPDNARNRWPVGMAVKKDSKDLSDALSEAMQALKSSGEISKIFAAHGVTWLP
jgi:ABC-type amino acid transport substrate-binding protein